MKRLVAKLLFCFLIFSLISHRSAAQNLTGIWRGHFTTEGMDQYKFELQIEQKGNRITGVTYSYLSTVFYGKAAATGFFNKGAKTALIQEIKTIEVRMAGSSVSCIQKFLFNYTRSGNEEFLEGTYTSTYEKTDPLMGINRGGNCGGGKIFLRKVTTSDFYVEPFLREKPSKPNNNIARNTTPKAKTPAPKPQTKTTLPSKTTTAKPKTTPAKPTVKAPAPKSKAPETTHQPAAPVVIPPPSNKDVPKTVITELPVIRNRTSDVVQTINVTSNDVTIKIYDNGEIDDDTVSVYLDHKLVLAEKRLTAAPLTYTFTMSEDQPEHTITMVAENLGRIPPNTSLMLVYSGDKRYEVRISTNEQKNAVIRFRYQKPQ